MKKEIYPLFAIVLALVSTACSSEADLQIAEYSPATVNINVPPTLYIAEGETSVGFEIKSTASWTIKDLPKWLKASMTSGQNDQTVYFTIEVNPSCSAQRADSFHVVAAEVTRSVAVLQEPAMEYLIVYDHQAKDNPDEFPSDGASYAFTIDSNTSWTLQADNEWVRLSETSGSGVGELTLQVDSNPLEETRTSLVTISSTFSTYSVTMTIRQAALIKPNPGENDNPTPEI